MESCPFCHQELEDADALECPHCHQSFTPPELHPYSGPVGMLEEMVDQVLCGNLDAAVAPTFFSQLLGSVQHVLDVARDQLADNLRKLTNSAQLEGIPEEARQTPLEFIQAFGELQELINEHMTSLSEILGESGTLADFERQRPVLESLIAQLQDAIGDLEQLNRMSSDPLLTVVPHQPMPEEISTSVHHFDLAMGAMRRYYDTRDRAHLERCLLHLDEARSRVKQVLMVGALDGD